MRQVFEAPGAGVGDAPGTRAAAYPEPLRDLLSAEIRRQYGTRAQDADAFLEEKQESKKDEEKKDRALQAAMIVSDQYANTEYVNTTVMTGALDIMIAKKRSVLASIAWQLVQFLFEVLAGISKSDDKTEKVPESSNESAEQSGKE